MMPRQGPEKKTVTGQLARYAMSNIFRQMMSILTLFIQPKLLAPELFGLWNLLKTIPAYATHAHLGLRDIARHQIPYNEARGKDDANAVIRGTLYTGSLYANVIIAFIVLPAALWPGFDAPDRVGVAAVVLIVLLSWRFDYLLMLMKAGQNFQRITRTNYIRSATAFVLSLSLILMFGIYGLYAATIVSLAVSIAALRFGYTEGSRRRFSMTAYKRLVRKGFPIMLFGIIIVMILTSGRIIISAMLGNEQLGYYSISVLVLSGMMQIPGAAREIIEPRLMQYMGNGGQSIPYDTYLLKPLVNTAYFMPYLISAVIIVFPLLCELILPRYVAGIEPTCIMSLGAYFLALSFTFRGVLVAQRWQAGAAGVMLLPLGFNIAGGIAVLYNGFGINGMAVITALSCFLLFLSILVFVLWRLHGLPVDWRNPLTALLFPFPVLLFLLWAGFQLAEFTGLNRYSAGGLHLIGSWFGLYFLGKTAGRRVALLDRFSFRAVFKGRSA